MCAISAPEKAQPHLEKRQAKLAVHLLWQHDASRQDHSKKDSFRTPVPSIPEPNDRDE